MNTIPYWTVKKPKKIDNTDNFYLLNNVCVISRQFYARSPTDPYFSEGERLLFCSQHRERRSLRFFVRFASSTIIFHPHLLLFRSIAVVLCFCTSVFFFSLITISKNSTKFHFLQNLFIIFSHCTILDRTSTPRKQVARFLFLL